MVPYKIFSYKTYPAFYCVYGNDKKILVEINSNFTLEYSEENMKGEPLKSNYYDISNECIENIKKVIENNKEIFDVNSSLNNGSLDGSMQEFWFASNTRNRKVSAYNIDDSIDDGHEIREEYMKQYGENLKQERLVLKVFFEICDELKKDGFNLDLFKFSTDKKDKYEDELKTYKNYNKGIKEETMLLLNGGDIKLEILDYELPNKRTRGEDDSWTIVDIFIDDGVINYTKYGYGLESIEIDELKAMFEQFISGKMKDYECFTPIEFPFKMIFYPKGYEYGTWCETLEDSKNKIYGVHPDIQLLVPFTDNNNAPLDSCYSYILKDDEVHDFYDFLNKVTSRKL